MKDIYDGEYKTCPVCGKRFYVLRPEMWAFKRNVQHKAVNGVFGLQYFDKYSCKKKFDDVYEGNLKDRKKIAHAKGHPDGKTCDECYYFQFLDGDYFCALGVAKHMYPGKQACSKLRTEWYGSER